MEYINITTKIKYESEIVLDKRIVLYIAEGCEGSHEMLETLEKLDLDADEKTKVLVVNSKWPECYDIIKDKGIRIPTVQFWINDKQDKGLIVDGPDVELLKINVKKFCK